MPWGMCVILPFSSCWLLQYNQREEHLTNLVRSCGKFKAEEYNFFFFFSSFGLYSTFLYLGYLFSLEPSHLLIESVFTAEPAVSY